MTATAAVTAALVGFLWRPAARLDFFFDEMWRVEQVRSADPLRAYLDGPAPIPPGWVVTLSAIFDVVPDRRPLLRLAAVAVAVPTGVLLAVVVRRVLERRTTRRRAWAAAVIAAPLTMAVPALAAHMTYFNNYLTDLAVAVAIVWALVAIDDPDDESMTPWWTLVVLAVIAPWFGQGALFLLPGAAVIVFRHRRAHPRIALAAAALAVLSSIVVGLGFLRPVANGATLTEFWRAETPDDGIVRFVRRFGSSFVDGAFPQSLDGRAVLVVVLFGFSAFGALVVSRAWAWWLLLLASALGGAVVTSVATGWPATFVRNNSSFQVLAYALAPIGIGVAIVHAAVWCRARTGSTAVAWSVAALLLIVASAPWLPRDIRANSESTGVFARGLTDDVSSIAVRARPGDLVVAYHLAGPYVRDRILNADDVDDDVTVIDEAREGPDVVTDLDRWIADDTQTIWCVVPFDAGPDASAAACRTKAGFTTVDVVTGRRATLIESQREP